MFVFALIALVAVANAMTIHDLPVTEEEHTMAFDAMVAGHARTYAKGSDEYNTRYSAFKENVKRIAKTVSEITGCVRDIAEHDLRCILLRRKTNKKKKKKKKKNLFFFLFCNTAWCSEEGQVRVELVL
jgi:hypothetical protein